MPCAIWGNLIAPLSDLACYEEVRLSIFQEGQKKPKYLDLKQRFKVWTVAPIFSATGGRSRAAEQVKETDRQIHRPKRRRPERPAALRPTLDFQLSRARPSLPPCARGSAALDRRAGLSLRLAAAGPWKVRNSGPPPFLLLPGPFFSRVERPPCCRWARAHAGKTCPHPRGLWQRARRGSVPSLSREGTIHYAMQSSGLNAPPRIGSDGTPSQFSRTAE